MFKQAKWVWVNAKSDVNQYVESVEKFQVEEEGSYTLAISVTGNYCVHINGKFVACARFDDYPEYKTYDEIEVGSYLKKGENRMEILAYALNIESCRSVPMQPAFIAELCDGQGKTLFYTQKGTKCRLSPVYRSGEIAKHGNKKSFSSEIFIAKNGESDFQESKEVGVDYQLIKRPCRRSLPQGILPSVLITQGVFRAEENLNIGEKLHGAWLSYRHLSTLSEQYEKPTFPREPLALCGHGENLYLIFDLLAEQNGYVHFDFELQEDALVEFAFGEHLEDMRVRSEIGGRNFTSVIHAKKGRNVFTDYINRLGCRYLQVHVYTTECKVRYFGMIYDGYPVTVYPYKTDNYLRKKIYDTSVKTLKECMHEHYEDCPWREQALYAMDSRNQMLCGYYTFREYEFARANLELLFKRFRKDGHLPLTAPGGDGLTIPCFSLVSVLSVLEYTEHSGDLSLARELLPKLEGILRLFLGFIDETGLLKRFTGDKSVWNFYEWTEDMSNGWNDHPLKEGSVEYPLVLNAFFVVALESYCKIGEILGMKTEAHAGYQAQADRIKQELCERFWLQEKECFAAYETDGVLSHENELSNAMALYCGAGTAMQRKIVAEKLKSGTLAPMTLSMTIYKYQALIDFDKDNIEYVLKDIDEAWGYMLFNKATTFWETIKGADDFGGAASLCHGWSAIPAYFYKKYGE